jgi:hypothetical protein
MYEPSNSIDEYYWTNVDSKFTTDCIENEKCITGSSFLDCYTKEVCNNKLNMEKLIKLRTTNTSSNGRFIDSTDNYNKLLLNSFNLGMGIVFLSSMIILQ